MTETRLDGKRIVITHADVMMGPVLRCPVCGGWVPR
jgi:hypothetical protein